MSFGERFLRYPDLFPARRAGERWGDHTLSIGLAGGPYVFDGLSAAQREAMAAHYEQFVIEGSKGFRCSVFAVDPEDFLEIDTRGWEYELDLDASADSLRMAGMQLMARFDWTPDPAAGVWTSEDRDGYFIGVIENVFRPAVAYQVAARGGLLLHSSGVVIDGKAILFVGQSGAGKSTVAGLALEHGLEILSDDLNVVERTDAGWTARRLPFSGDHRSAGADTSYDLAAIYRLRQGADHAVTTMSPAETYALLISACPYVNVDSFRSGQAGETVERLVMDVPKKCLTFKRDSGFWPMMEAE